MRILDRAEFLRLARDRRAAGRAPVAEAVRDIITQVREGGDRALCDLTARFDGATLAPELLEVSGNEIDSAGMQVSGDFLEALDAAIESVRAYHEAEPRDSWWIDRPDGSRLGQLLSPIPRVGLYVPGGTAPLVSTVLMLGIPARVAGVPELILCTPPRRNGTVDPHILTAARAVGVQRVFRIGGAQAIAAMANGTERVPKVDFIAGPGNVYVTAAKQLVFGEVGIDGLMGPSEVAVLAEEGGAPPEWIAADLLAQAEHDPMAACYLVTTSESLARAVLADLGRRLPRLPRAQTARESVERWAAATVVASLDEGVAVVDELAPEHLQILTRDPERWAARVRCAGAVFCGPWSPEPAGDYAAGPSHVLPTSGAARHASVVSVATFLRRTSVIHLSRDGFDALAGPVQALAEVEGLAAHAESIRVRTDRQAPINTEGAQS